MRKLWNTALLEGIFREGQMHFLIGDDSGMLVWQRTEDGAEIVAIHNLPQSWGTGGPVGFTRSTASAGTGTERISEFDGAAEVRYVRN